jgi:apolipoprotein N-acyltransferase
MLRAIDEPTILRWGYAITGLVFLFAAVLSAGLARDHMAGLSMICGAATSHCGWCYAAAGSAFMALASLAAARRPVPAKARRTGEA